jgi:hypothetical protein
VALQTGIRVGKVQRAVREANPERAAHEALAAPRGRVALRETLAKVRVAALVQVVQSQGLLGPGALVKKDAPTPGRPEAQPQGSRLIQMARPVCGQKAAHVGHAIRVVQARAKVRRPVVRALRHAAADPESQVAGVRKRVPVTAVQTVLASHAQHRAVMIGSPRVRPRTSRV